MTDTLTLISIILVIGSCGAYEVGNIGFGQAVAQMAVLLLICGILRLNRIRMQNRLYRQRINMQKGQAHVDISM